MCSEATSAEHDHTHGVYHDVVPSAIFDLEPVDSVTVMTLMDNVTDSLMVDQGPAHRNTSKRKRPSETMHEREVPDTLRAEHGFSVLLTVKRSGSSHNILFDTGTTPDGVTENMRRLDVDISAVEAIVCSHGHYDHTAGLDGIIQQLGTVNLPVLIHPHFWRRRRLSIPSGELKEIPTTSRRALLDAGFDIIEEGHPSFLFNNSVLVTGEVPRTTGYEPGVPSQKAWLNGRWEPDSLVLDDQAVIVDIKDKGLVVITGCGHAGIVNICRYAMRLTNDRPIHAVMGGFHLSGSRFQSLIPRVVDALDALKPSVVVPAHCTGWRAQHALGARLGDAFIPNSVGTRFEL